MKTTFRLLGVDDIEASMTITMTVGKWKQLAETIKTEYPGWQFAAAIGSLVRIAEQRIEAERGGA